MNARGISAVAGSVIACALVSSCGSGSRPARPSPSPTDRVNSVAGGCVARHQLGPRLKQFAARGESTVLAHVQLTGRTVLGPGAADGYVYTEVRVSIYRTLAGPVRARVVTAYVIGGTRDGVTTSGDSESSVAWSPTGEVFATLDPSPVAGAFELGALPVIGSSVAFVGVGCFDPIGYPQRPTTHAVVFLRSGSRTVETVTYPAVALRTIERSMR